MEQRSTCLPPQAEVLSAGTTDETPAGFTARTSSSSGTPASRHLTRPARSGRLAFPAVARIRRPARLRLADAFGLRPIGLRWRIANASRVHRQGLGAHHVSW